MSYRRRDRQFEATLAQRADEISHRTAVTRNHQGQIVVLELPALTFPDEQSACRWLRMLIRESRKEQR